MGIIMPETCWAVSVRQSNKILRLTVASSWVFYLSDWRCTEPQSLNTFFLSFFLYYCRRSCSCQQYKSVQCCRGKCNNWFPLHCCRATKYFILLSATISIKIYERVSAFLPYLSQKKIASFTRRITLSSVACLVLVCSNKSSHKQHGLGKKILFNMERALWVSLKFLSEKNSHPNKNSATYCHTNT